MALFSFLPWILALSGTVSVLGLSCSARAQAVNDFPGAVMVAVDRSERFLAELLGRARAAMPPPRRREA
jgi:hypothetical protein